MPARRAGRATLGAAPSRRRDDCRRTFGPLAPGPGRSRRAARSLSTRAGEHGALHRGADRPGSLHVPRWARLRRQADQTSRRHRGGRIGRGDPHTACAGSDCRLAAAEQRNLVRKRCLAALGDDVLGRVDRNHRVSDARANHFRTAAVRNAARYARPDLRCDRRRPLLVHPGRCARHPSRRSQHRRHGNSRWHVVHGIAPDDRAQGPGRPRREIRTPERGQRANVQCGARVAHDVRMVHRRHRHLCDIRRVRSGRGNAIRLLRPATHCQARAAGDHVVAAAVLRLLGAEYPDRPGQQPETVGSDGGNAPAVDHRKGSFVLIRRVAEESPSS